MIIDAKEYQRNMIGRIGENESRTLRFDVNEIIREFPDATFSILNTRPTDTDAYPVNGQYVELRDGYLFWTLQSGDLMYAGTGECQVVATQGNAIQKTVRYTTFIDKALDGNGTPPEPWQSWQQEIIEYVRRAGVAVTHYPRIGMLGNWEVWDVTNEEWVDTEISARGPKGHKGEKGETGNGIAYVELNNDYTLTIHFTNGQEYTTGSIRGAKGEQGDPGANGHDGYTPRKGVDYFDGHTPVITAEKTAAKLTTIYADGVAIAIIADGSDGTDGEDGFSPTVTVEDITDGHRVTITDANGPHEYNVMDGVDGKDGQDGSDGEDGFSPVVAVTDITHGHRVTITDANGDHVYDVLDGTSNLDDTTTATDKVWSSKKTKTELDDKAPVIICSAAGNPAVFADGSAGLPIESLKVTLLPVQQGSGDASPQNIRSIVPWNGLTVFGGGKNYASDISNRGNMQSTDGVWSNSNTDSKTYLHAVIQFFNGSTYIKNSVDKSISQSGMQSMTFNVDVPNCNLIVLKHSGSQRDLSLQFPFSGEQGEYTISFNALSTNPNVVGGLKLSTIEMVKGTPTETDISFASPVYGCVYNIVSGMQTVQYGIVSLDTVRFYAVKSGFFASYASLPEYADRTKLMCNAYKVVSKTYWDDMLDCEVMGIPEGGIIRIKDESCEDVDALYAKLTEIGAVLVYPLTDPQTVQLTPAQLQTLLGNNTIWSDANGNVEVKYRADTKLFVNQSFDVQIGGTSILEDGVANIPYGSSSAIGALKTDTAYGTGVTSGHAIAIASANDNMLKAGTDNYRPVVPSIQHKSLFYALAKLAGADMKNSSNEIGTYTDEALQAIQKLLGFVGLLGPYEDDITADRAYAIGETFVMDGKRYKATDAISQGGVITPGSNCELDPLDGKYVRNTDYATTDKAGVVRYNNDYGISVIMSGAGVGMLRTYPAFAAQIKAGVNAYRPIVPEKQHESVFYALSKLAGVDLASSDTPVGTYTAEAKAAILAMLGANGNGLEISNGSLQITGAGATTVKAGTSWYYPIIPALLHNAVYYGLSKLAGVDLANETVTVGTYPQSSKTAIQTMLGIEADVPLVEEVSGATPSITGMPNVRYVCGTVSTLSITPPASGSIVVRFHSGSTATVLTVPNTVKFPAWFDSTALEAEMTYEIIITDGVYGGVMSWAD